MTEETAHVRVNVSMTHPRVCPSGRCRRRAGREKHGQNWPEVGNESMGNVLALCRPGHLAYMAQRS